MYYSSIHLEETLKNLYSGQQIFETDAFRIKIHNITATSNY